jgi:hypothetical protein
MTGCEVNKVTPTMGDNIAEGIVISQPIAIESSPGNDACRRSARYDCVGVAEILRIQKATGEFVTGKIRNLSLGGCNIETESPLEPGSQLAVMFQVNTLRMRLVAEIRSVNMGGRYSARLEFVGMTAPELQGLQKLIAKLSEKA